MTLDLKSLPDDADGLKKIVSEMYSEYRMLQEENRLLKQKLFGPKSEKISEEERRQLVLFNEAEAGAAAEPEAPPADEILVAPHTRTTKRGRKALPAHLPRVEVVHDLPEAQKRCGCGAQKQRIGEETSERLDIVPAKIQVIRDIRPKYACRVCEGVDDAGPTVAIAPPPPQLIPKGIATAGLLAYALTAKFVDATPFYRQAKQFERLGVELSRTTLCHWALQVAERCRPLLDLLTETVRAGPLIGCDETTVQVLDEPGRAAQTQSYMWVFRGGPPERPAIEYRYHPTRSGQVAKDYLQAYQGVVQTDGYAGYDFLDHQPGVVHAGCWAHVRRKFVEVTQAAGGKQGAGTRKAGSADVALATIQKLYALEHRARDRELTPAQRRAERQAKARPLLEEFRRWLDDKATKTPPKTLLGKAIAYTLGQWPRLTVYLDEEHLTPDNNLVENAIRPFCVGRKNWLFSATPHGAAASAALYSLIETAKANGLEPYAYLRYVFERLPLASSPEEYRRLLPQSLTRADLAPIWAGVPGGS